MLELGKNGTTFYIQGKDNLERYQWKGILPYGESPITKGEHFAKLLDESIKRLASEYKEQEEA